MDLNALIEQVVKEVGARVAALEEPAPPACKKKVLILTEQHCDDCLLGVLKDVCACDCALAREYQGCDGDYDAVVLGELPLAALGKLASGQLDTPYTALAGRALLRGTPVYALRQGVELLAYEATAPKAYYAALYRNVELLCASGMKLADAGEIIAAVSCCAPACEPAETPCACCGEKPACTHTLTKKLLSERDVLHLRNEGVNVIRLAPGGIATQLALDCAKKYGVAVETALGVAL